MVKDTQKIRRLGLFDHCVLDHLFGWRLKG